ncbi:MAG: DJ-1/PfpI family protein [Thermoplasmata archaeon]
MRILTKQVGVIIDEGFHDLELWVPYYVMKANDISFDVLAWENRDYKGQFGIDVIRPSRLLHELNKDTTKEYNLIFLPGAKSPENLLKNPKTIEVITHLYETGSTFATICHAPLVLGEVGLLKGKKITGHHSIKKEVDKYGAIFLDQPVVKTSERIITARTHFDLGTFLPELISLVQ